MICKLPFLARNTKVSPHHCVKSIYLVHGSSIQSGLFIVGVAARYKRYTTVNAQNEL